MKIVGVDQKNISRKNVEMSFFPDEVLRSVWSARKHAFSGLVFSDKDSFGPTNPGACYLTGDKFQPYLCPYPRSTFILDAWAFRSYQDYGLESATVQALPLGFYQLIAVEGQEIQLTLDQERRVGARCFVYDEDCILTWQSVDTGKLFMTNGSGLTTWKPEIDGPVGKGLFKKSSDNLILQESDTAVLVFPHENNFTRIERLWGDIEGLKSFKN